MNKSILTILFSTFLYSISFAQFEEPVAFETTISSLRGINSKDVNGDGYPDLLLARTTGFYYYQNDGNGSFEPAVEIGDEMRRITDIEIADLDADGDLDIAYVSGVFQKSIGWFKNNGADGYETRVFPLNSSDLGRAYDIELADLDGDGDLDFITTNYDKEVLRITYNAGNGTFTGGPLIDSPIWMLSTKIYDNDGDGIPEIYYVSYSGNQFVAIGYYKRTSQGLYEENTINALSGNNSNLLELVDVDLDGDLDAIAGHFNSKNIEWSEHQGNGVYGDEQQIWRDAEFQLDSKISKMHLETHATGIKIYAWSEMGSMYRIDQIAGTTDFADPVTLFEGPHEFSQDPEKKNSQADFNQDGAIDIAYISADTLWIRTAIPPPIDADNDGFNVDEDCDDNNPDVNPDQDEIPYNGLDDDCDAETFDDDLDQDGFLLADDCDDENADINPDAVEIPNNGIDEDCDDMDLVNAIHQLSNSTINIYPNPASAFITIAVNGQLDFQANLYDLQGRLILSTNSSQLLIDSFPTGTYLLEIKDLDSGERVFERIVIGR